MRDADVEGNLKGAEDAQIARTSIPIAEGFTNTLQEIRS